jgi:sulfate adenylyltransferase subunit 2
LALRFPVSVASCIVHKSFSAFKKNSVPMTEAPLRSLQQLNQRRQRAVELRLAGKTLPQIHVETGLSAPTIISAYKAFLRAGWGGVATPARGRRAGVGRALGPLQEAALHLSMLTRPPEAAGGAPGLWTAPAISRAAHDHHGSMLAGRALTRSLQRAGLDFLPLAALAARSALVEEWRRAQWPALLRRAQHQGAMVAWCGQVSLPAPPGQTGRRRLLLAQSLRGSLAWLPLGDAHHIDSYLDFLTRLARTWPAKPLHLLMHGIDAQRQPALDDWLALHPGWLIAPCPAAQTAKPPVALAAPQATAQASAGPATIPPTSPSSNQAAAPAPASPLAARDRPTMKLTHLQRLEAESIHIMREVVAETENPVMLYSVGKDSATMLHLAKKAFYPSPPPFPLLHVDTTWKFRDMYTLRDRMSAEMGMQLLTYRNPEAEALGINPFTHGSQIHTDMWKTQGLKQALDLHGFDAAFGGARRDEEKSRAKERIFSFRSTQHRWDPKFQRPELWKLYNARKHQGESIRVFPISNWTELDIWQYIHLENITIVPLYFAAERPVVERDGTLIMVDDARMPLKVGEVPVMRKVRFRTLGCYPLTGAVESEADTLPAIIQEMLLTRTSERQGRMIDHDSSASMEKKKQEGYF